MDKSRQTYANDTFNNTLSSKQTPFRAHLTASKKKKAHALVPKIAVKSKRIDKADSYAAIKKK